MADEGNIDLGGLSARVEIDVGRAAAELGRVREALATTNGQLTRLEEQARDAGGASAELAEKIDYLRTRQVELRQAVLELSAAAEAQRSSMQALATQTHQVDASMAMTARQMKGVAFASLEVSRGLEDLATGGFLGALNNIPQAFMGIGMAAGLSSTAIAGLTAGVSLAATAAYMLYTHYGDLEELFIGKYTEEESVRMERLADSTHRTAQETKELHKYKQAIADLEKLNAMTSDDEKARATATAHAIGEAGPGKAQAAVARGLYDGATAARARYADQLADMRAASAAKGGAMTQAEQLRYRAIQAKSEALKAMQGAGVGAFRDQATDLLLKASKPGGNKEFEAIRRMMARRPQDFGGGLVRGFDAVAPEQRKLDQAGKDQGARLEEGARVKKEARHELVDTLNRQGQEGEREARDQNPEVFERAGHQRRREEAEAKRRQHKDEVERRKKVAQAATAFGPALADDTQLGLLAGQSDQDARKAVHEKLRQTGRVDPAVMVEAAEAIVEHAKDALEAKVLAAAARGDRDPKGAARAEILDRRAKFLDRRDKAGDKAHALAERRLIQAELWRVHGDSGKPAEDTAKHIQKLMDDGLDIQAATDRARAETIDRINRERRGKKGAKVRVPGAANGFRSVRPGDDDPDMGIFDAAERIKAVLAGLPPRDPAEMAARARAFFGPTGDGARGIADPLLDRAPAFRDGVNGQPGANGRDGADAALGKGLDRLLQENLTAVRALNTQLGRGLSAVLK